MKSLLIVDDNKDYVRSLERALSSEWNVVSARSAEEARQRISNYEPDIALVDVRLSDVDPDNRDGVQVLKWLRDRFPKLPVVMMSAYRDFDAAVEALNLGSDYFLKKPIDLRELKQLLRALVEHLPLKFSKEELRDSLKDRKL